jgi:methionyl aminopeptidase
MSHRIKTIGEIDAIREAGRIVSLALHTLEREIANGERSTLRLDEIAEDVLRANGAKSAFRGYVPPEPYNDKPYPCTTCISVNNEIAHGVPSELKILNEGDVASLDLGAEVDGWFADAAITVGVGDISTGARNLIYATRLALKEGIRAAKPGGTLGDIGEAIETFAKRHHYRIAKGLTGHFIGQAVHEEPEVPNYGRKRTGIVLEPGMVFCVEPMLNIGTEEVYIAGKGFWTYVTADEMPSAHFEHTIAITDNGVEILTRE